MEATIEHLGEVKFAAVARGHRVICDQPVENAGANSGMSPPEFLLVSLGTCAGYYAVQYLKARGLATQGLRVRVEADKAAAPARLAGFRIEVQAPAGLEERHRAGVLRAVQSCLIHNTLLSSPAIQTAVEVPVEATA